MSQPTGKALRRRLKKAQRLCREICVANHLPTVVIDDPQNPEVLRDWEAERAAAQASLGARRLAAMTRLMVRGKG